MMGRRNSVLTNRDTVPYQQTIEEKEYYIAPGGTLELPRREAVKVRGYYPGKGIKTMLDIKHLGDDGPEVHACNKCGMIFEHSSELIEHMEEHFAKEEKKEVKVYSCHFCNREFERKAALMSHMRSHTNDKQEKIEDDASPSTIDS